MYSRIYILPIFMFVWYLGGFALAYAVALYNKNIVLFMPYVSDLGAKPPENCIFAQVLNVGALLMVLAMYVRYRQVKLISKTYDLLHYVQFVNDTSLWLGIIAAFGVTLIGNFPETTMFIMHLIGTGMGFGFGNTYLFLQAVLSRRISSKAGTILCVYLRFGMSIICIICSIFFTLSGIISLILFDGEDVTKWSPRESGYTAHAISATAEWVMVTLTIGYLTTFTSEFRKIKMYPPKLEIVKKQQIERKTESNK